LGEPPLCGFVFNDFRQYPRSVSNSNSISETFAQALVSDPLVRTAKTKHIVQSVLLISAAACISFWVFSYDGDERKVFRVAVEEVHGSDGVEQYVLRANTGPCTPFGMSSFHRKKLAVPVSARAIATVIAG
jgi:hypothetical protein